MVAGRLFGELLVGGLVFISGYTHFTHYWMHADFTRKRLATVSDEIVSCSNTTAAQVHLLNPVVHPADS